MKQSGNMHGVMNSIQHHWIPQSGLYVLLFLFSVYIVTINVECMFVRKLNDNKQARTKIGNLGNGELEYYLAEMVSVSGGNLVLTCDETTYEVLIPLVVMESDILCRVSLTFLGG